MEVVTLFFFTLQLLTTMVELFPLLEPYTLLQKKLRTGRSRSCDGGLALVHLEPACQLHGCHHQILTFVTSSSNHFPDQV